MESAEATRDKLRETYNALLAKPLKIPNFWAGVLNNQPKWHAYCMELAAFSCECDAFPDSGDVRDMSAEAKEQIAKIAGYCMDEGDLEIRHGHRQEGESWFRTAIEIYKLIPERKDSGMNIDACEKQLRPVPQPAKSPAAFGCAGVSAVFLFLAVSFLVCLTAHILN